MAKVKLLDTLPLNLMDNRVAKTEDGQLVLVPHGTRIGDQIALLQGGNCPFVVRSSGPDWKLVGGSYAHGMMKGERWDEQKSNAMGFV